MNPTAEKTKTELMNSGLLGSCVIAPVSFRDKDAHVKPQASTFSKFVHKVGDIASSRVVPYHLSVFVQSFLFEGKDVLKQDDIAFASCDFGNLDDFP